MIATLDRDEQSSLLERLEESGVQFAGFAPTLEGELSIELGLLYSRKIGEVTLLRKLKERSMDKRDIDYAVDFLIEHCVQPNKDNVFRLWMAARIYLLFDAKSPGWVEERLARYER
jgi:hypothetical protein